MTRRLASTLVAVALAGTGCGSSSSPSDPATDGTGSTLSAQEKGVKFAECIRAHGVGDFPDPDAKGEFQYGVSVSASVWRKAVDACKDLQPPGSLSSKRTPKQEAAALRVAQCIRAHGVKDFPDPVNGEPLINTYKIPSANQPGGMDILNAAIAQCTDALETAAGGER